MFETDKLVAAIFAAALVNKRSVAKIDEYLLYYDNFLTELRKRAEKAHGAEAAPPSDPPAPPAP